MQYSFKILGLGTAFTFGSLLANAQEAAPAAEWSLSINELLVAFAFLLLLVIVALSATILAALKHYRANILNKKTGTTLLLLLAMALPLASKAQEAATDVAVAAPLAIDMSENMIFRYVLYFIILMELLAIVLLAKYTRALLQPETLEAEHTVKKQIDWKSLWLRFNRLKPMAQEEEIAIDHSYDGIRELDNATPPWFTIGFGLSILAAVIYLYRFIGGVAPTQIEEYNTAVAKAEEAQAIYMAAQKDMVDENTVVMLDANGIAAGKMLYSTNCVACHGALGEGGVGPNLTDVNWIHGGSLHTVFKSIKYGYPEKGMKSWKDDFSPVQIAQLTSYVETLKGTNPAGAKAPQGEVYTEEAGDVKELAPADPAKPSKPSDTATAPGAVTNDGVKI